LTAVQYGFFGEGMLGGTATGPASRASLTFV